LRINLGHLEQSHPKNQNYANNIRIREKEKENIIDEFRHKNNIGKKQFHYYHYFGASVFSHFLNPKKLFVTTSNH
jgi:hypothetical protein